MRRALVSVHPQVAHNSSHPPPRLTDEVSRQNWELYGNPDGPQAAVFGIALPSWIVDKDNSIWVCVPVAWSLPCT